MKARKYSDEEGTHIEVTGDTGEAITILFVACVFTLLAGLGLAYLLIYVCGL